MSDLNQLRMVFAGKWNDSKFNRQSANSKRVSSESIKNCVRSKSNRISEVGSEEGYTHTHTHTHTHRIKIDGDPCRWRIPSSIPNGRQMVETDRQRNGAGGESTGMPWMFQIEPPDEAGLKESPRIPKSLEHSRDRVAPSIWTRIRWAFENSSHEESPK